MKPTARTFILGLKDATSSPAEPPVVQNPGSKSALVYEEDEPQSNKCELVDYTVYRYVRKNS